MVTFNRIDLEFILEQIKMAEQGQPPVSPHLAFGLREVAGTNNNTVPGNGLFGSSDQPFLRATDPLFQSADFGSTYAQSFGLVFDSDPRIISNLIADQTASNPAALAAQAGSTPGDGYLPGSNPNTPPDVAPDGSLFIPNVTPDSGLSAPYNTWFTLFGQFFDHGLDLISKGGSGTVFIQLQPDDPLITLGPDGIAGTGDEVTNPGLQFMVLTRATVDAGADGLLGTADDVNNSGTNTITPFVDQSQTYSSHPSHQVFLREYIGKAGVDGIAGNGDDLAAVQATGRMLSHVNTDGSEHMATWADLKANALKLGILLTDRDVNNVPLLATDAYGNLIPGAHGYAQVVVLLADGVTTVLVEGNAAGLDIHNPAALLGGTAMGTGVAFINDKAHAADPFDAQTGALLTPDADTDAGNAPAAGFYDNELLDAHYVAGDGRVNENIGLTAIHDIFHSEHNRQIAQIEALVQQQLDNGDQSFALNWVRPGVSLATNADGSAHQITADEWDGERLFQAAKFATETQYQHLVFEEFARKIAPTVHLFGNNDIHLDPAIMAEFANVVYRFGHSMLDDTLNRLDANGNPIDTDGNPLTVDPQMSLIEAFTNPLAYLNQGADAAGELVRGSTLQIGNEIDEFVTGALRNNLLGLPLDLAALNLARGRDTGVAPLNLVRNEIYSQIGDATLKPYESWDDFGQYLKHPASLINFVAAYGTHHTILEATTIEGKRAAALDLVLHASVNDPSNPAQPNPAFDQDAYDFMHSLGAYANDKNNPLAIHDAAGNVATWSTGSITGLDNVDLWIGGLAEKQNLFGGLLGSTFNFIFETQMEALQDGDRLYYLPRIEGMPFGSEIEANTFASLIMANTQAKHLSANIFMTPEYVVEASTIDPNDPSTWLHNPVTGKLLIDVLNDGTIRFLGDDNFFGNTIVMGGTEGDDKLLSGNADDDTVYGDGGNDTLDGGGGNDVVFGGTGNDFITDIAGDDIIHGDQGNDTIFSGIGDDTVFGGDGNDLIDGGAGIDDIVGGTGNDIIFGGEDDDEIQGNEGDDWIEGGAGGDILTGDVGAPTGQVPLYGGNDVLDGGAQGDKMVGFTGDDIMLGEGGFDKFLGKLGFDWGSFQNETHGVSVDMERREFIPDQIAPAGDAVRDFWIETEGFSGSKYDDVALGTNDAKLDPFNELANVNLITGLDRYFPDAIKVDPITGATTGTPVAFSGGNIMLGGGGSDQLAGRGGNDIIDGDARLHVALTRDANGNIFAGSEIIREILTDQAVAPTFDPLTGLALTAGDIDTAVFSDVSTNYVISFATDAAGNLLFGTDGNIALTVQHLVNGVAGIDGTDTLYNIERLQFSDVTIETGTFNFAPIADFVPQGTVTIDDPPGTPLPAATPPLVGDTLSIDTHLAADGTVLSFINDFEGVLVNGVLDPATAGFFRTDIPVSELHLQWQYQDAAHPGFIDIAGANGATFTPTDFFVGSTLRLEVSYVDGLGVTERVFSAETAILAFDPTVNHAPTVQAQVAVPGLPDTTAYQNSTLTPYFVPLVTVFTDDTTPAANLIYTAVLASTGHVLDGSAAAMGLTFTLVPDGAGGVTGALITGTPPAGFHGPIDIRVSATDAGDPGTGANPLTVTDTFTINVLPEAAPVITSNDGGATAALFVAENTSAVTTVTATDVNTQDVLTFSIVGGADQSKFTINPVTGALLFVTAPNFEVPTDADHNNVYDVIVQVSDGTLTDTQAIAVRVTDVNEPPVITSNGGGATASVLAAENLTAVTVVTATDPDAGATVTFSIAGGADASKFNIDPLTGALSFKAAPDFEHPTDAGLNNVYDVVVRATDQFGLADTQAIAVTVNNANEAPVITSNGGGATAAVAINENLTAVTTVTASDPDAATTLTFSIVGGADASQFTINPVTGALSFVAAPDFEAPTDADHNNVYNVIVQASDGSLVDTQAIAVTVNNILGVTITGTNAANTVNATTTVAGQPLPTSEEDTILGLGGNDILAGLGGSDLIDGGAGADNIQGGDGNDTIIGGAGNDALSGEAGNDTFLYAIGDGADVVDGGLGNDTLQITGAAANDTLAVVYDGSVLTSVEAGTVTSVETIRADLGTGVDTLSYSTSAANVTVNLATPSASGFASIAGIENVTGGSGSDILIGDANANTLTGGGGDDTLAGGLGNDILIGGAGTDTASYTGEIDNWFIDLGTGTARRGAAAAAIEDTLTTLENIVGGLGNDTITGSTAVNILDGGAGNDTLLGLAGNDTLIGGLGSDTLNGGLGNDALFGGADNDIFIYTIGDGADTVDGGDNVDTLNIGGSTGNDTLNVVFNGVITTFEGSTVTNVEAINANLAAGTDTLSYAASTANVTVNLTTSSASGFASVTGIENVTGGSGNDTLTGDANANALTGGAGDDSFIATLNDGNDAYVGGAGVDTYDLSATTAGATVNLAAGTSTSAQTGTDTLATIENVIGSQGNDTITGDGAANFLSGGLGADNISAGGGVDTLIGGAGNDIMDSGAGNDFFVFANGFGNDTINGFDANPTGGQDLLDISAFGITAANFAANVTITVSGGNTLVDIAGVDNTITLVGVNGVGTNAITVQDFLLTI